MKILSAMVSLLGDNAASWRIWNIARILESRGHEVHLIQYLPRTVYERRKKNKFDISNLRNSIIVTPVPTIPARHLMELSKNDYDLVYGNASIATACAILGKFKGVPLVFDMHGGIVEEFFLNNQPDSRWECTPELFKFVLYKIIDYVDLHFSNKIICVSKKMIHYLHTHKKIPLGKMIYLPNGVDLDFFNPSDNEEQVWLLRKELGIESKLVFGYVGGFQKWQGAEDFLQAAGEIEKEGIVFVIVGGREQERKNNVLFIPRMSQDQVLNYYSACDVLVLPRPSHPATEIASPTKFAEYTAMGKPILTTNVGDAANLVKEYSCGLVVEDNSLRRLSEGIMEFREKSQDDIVAMGRNSRRLAEKEFDWNIIADNLLRTIEETALKK